MTEQEREELVERLEGAEQERLEQLPPEELVPDSVLEEYHEIAVEAEMAAYHKRLAAMSDAELLEHAGQDGEEAADA
jgi:hypothetical protein